MNASYMKYMANPKGFTLKKWFSELLKDKFRKHEPIVDRISPSLVTDKDLSDFSQLMIDTYESGYMKAINDYKEQFEKMGVKINIVADSSQKSLD